MIAELRWTDKDHEAVIERADLPLEEQPETTGLVRGARELRGDHGRALAADVTIAEPGGVARAAGQSPFHL